MLVKLKKSNKNYNYVRKRNVDVADLQCPERDCFWPVNHHYSTSDGKQVDRFMCNTRAYDGCPEIQISKAYAERKGNDYGVF